MQVGPREQVASPVDEDERAFRAAFAQLVEWYRVEQWRALWHAFWPGFVLLPLGSLIVALTMIDRLVPYALRPALTIAGVLVTASGPLWAIVQLFGSIRRDLYLAIRVDGLAVRLDPAREEMVYPWEAIADVRCNDAGKVLVLTLTTGELVPIAAVFSELALPELGRRIRDARRLAVWNRLSPRFDCAEASE